MEGIKETREILEFVAVLANALAKGLADGEISLADGVALLPALTKAPAAFGGLSMLKSEAADYTSDEVSALSAYFKSQLDLPNDTVEGYFEAGLEVALNLAKLLGGLRK